MDDSVIGNVSDTNVTQGQETAAQAAERLFKQSELNEIVGRAKHEAVESFKRQQSQQQSTSQQSYEAPKNHALSADDVKRLTAEEITRQRQEIAKEAQEKAEAEAAQRIVNNYKDKIAPGKDKYTDFEAVTGKVNMAAYPNVVQLLADYVDNSHDVLYELAKNRTKLSHLEFTCAHNPPDAIYEIKRLSDSIKENEQSSQMKQAKSPLSQLRPSNTGTDSGTTLSMADLKRKYKG